MKRIIEFLKLNLLEYKFVIGFFAGILFGIPVAIQPAWNHALLILFAICSIVLMCIDYKINAIFISTFSLIIFSTIARGHLEMTGFILPLLLFNCILYKKEAIKHYWNKLGEDLRKGYMYRILH